MTNIRKALPVLKFAALLAILPQVAGAANRSLEGQQIVLYTFGGTQLETTRELVIKPFEEETGAKVIVDDSCCTRLNASTEAGQFIGDVIIGIDQSSMLARADRGQLMSDPRLEKIARDYGVPENYISKTSLVLHSYSYVIAAREGLTLPKSWAEFWDRNKFPGSRGLNRISPNVQLEAGVLAAGVSPEKLYPIDEELAFKSLTELRNSGKTIFNASGADQINNLGTGETDYAVAYSNRLYMAKKEGIKVNFTYGGGFIVGNGGAILKGAKNVDGAVAFLAYHMRPEVLARFAERTGMAPSYERASEMIDTKYRDLLPTAPDNVKRQRFLDVKYWHQNFIRLNDRWVNWLAQ